MTFKQADIVGMLLGGILAGILFFIFWKLSL